MLAPTTFQEADLIGHWETLFPKYSQETLVLTADHRFVQVFEMVQPARREEIHGTWYIDRRSSGCVYVHLEGMRYFYGAEAFERYGNRFIPGGEPYSFWERCEEQRMTMPDKVILTVTDEPNLPRGIGLIFPATSNDPMNGESFRLREGAP